MAQVETQQQVAAEGNQPATTVATPSTFDSVALEGQRLARETAGDLAALAALYANLPRQLKDSVVLATQQLFGNRVAVEVVAQHQATSNPTTDDANSLAAPAAMDDLHRVMAHAGHHVTDRGGFVYVVCADGSFEIVHAPGGKAIGRKITASGVYGKAWTTLAALVPAAPPALHAEPATKATATSNTDAPSQSPHAGREAPTDLAAGIAHFKTKPASIQGDTLDIAQTRAQLGLGGTTYSLTGMTKTEEESFNTGMADNKSQLAAAQTAAKDKTLSAAARATLVAQQTDLKADIAASNQTKQEVNTDYAADLAKGSATQDMFYCSGLSIWTMAAAGYDVNAQLVAADGQPYYGDVLAEVMVDANGKRVFQAKNSVGKKRISVEKVYVTLKKLIDGDPKAIEIMTRAQGRTTGGSVGEIMGTGYETEHDGDGLPLAAHGAAGAFELAGIGAEVDELQQKPGDFAQSRRSNKDAVTKEIKQRGFGHAWQVTETQVFGDAMFGQAGSPVPVAGKLDGWHNDVAFTITNDTDPALVGKHVVTHAKRIEAQNKDVVSNKSADSNSDGGVQLTGKHAVPDHGLPGYTDYSVYYGRLGESRWYGWEPAVAPSK
ncbi:MAG: hypothetical protein KBG15_14430 [Kofleriaceae bacterium]|nr:hypothetical protein [Kofleriaceae bacterium]